MDVQNFYKEYIDDIAAGKEMFLGESSVKTVMRARAVKDRERLRGYTRRMGQDPTRFGYPEGESLTFMLDKEDECHLFICQVEKDEGNWYAKRMFHFAQRIRQMEELRALGVTTGCCALICEDPGFRVGMKRDGIYAPFRGGAILEGSYTIDETEGGPASVTLAGHYEMKWRGSDGRYCLFVVI